MRQVRDQTRTCSTKAGDAGRGPTFSLDRDVPGHQDPQLCPDTVCHWPDKHGAKPVRDDAYPAGLLVYLAVAAGKRDTAPPIRAMDKLG